jgi:membrane-associated phospholipid phosphatase
VADLALKRPSWERVLSDVLSPPVVWGALAVPMSMRATGSLEAALPWALIYIGLVCIMPAAYIGIEVWRGRISDMHINLREQRLRPYAVSLLGVGLAFVVMGLLGAPQLMVVFTLFTLVQMALMLVFTTRWKISMHSMSITSAVVTMGLLFGLTVFLLLTPLILLVSVARVSLKRHSVRQVIAGILLGGSVTLAMGLLIWPLLQPA